MCGLPSSSFTGAPTQPPGSVSNPETEKHNALLRSLCPLDPSSCPFTAIPQPPDDNAYCSVTLIRTGTIARFPAWYVADGEAKDGLRNFPCPCFLIEKKRRDGSVERVMFELGLRDVSNLSFSPSRDLRPNDVLTPLTREAQ